MPTSSSAPSRGCTRPASSKARVSVWPPCSASSAATAATCGPRARWRKAPPSASRCPSPWAAVAAHGLGQREAEGGAFLHLALGPHVAAVAADDALHGGQTDTRAFELAGRVQPLEGAEQLVRIGHVEAGAVVAHEEGALACVSGCAGVVRPFAQSVGEAAPARRDGSDLDARRCAASTASAR